jgi:hypothetical protein
MIWLTWRQFRPQAITSLTVLAAFAVLLGATGPPLVVWHFLRRPQEAALVRCRVTSHGLSLRLERGGGVSAGLLHFPAGKAAGSFRWPRSVRHAVAAPSAGHHEMTCIGCPADSAAAGWPAVSGRAGESLPSPDASPVQ